MKTINKLFLQVVHFLYPGNCILCNGKLIFPKEIHYSLCCSCEKSITPNLDTKCNLCGKPLISEIETCLSCRNNESSFTRIFLLYPYIGKYRKLLTEYKFKANRFLANFFADKILEIILEEESLNDVTIVPVPPRPGKVKHTGWDQVDYLVKRMKKNNLCPPVFCCLKRRKSKVQKSLNRKERMDNLKGKIYLNKIPPKKVLVIDDVLTTGSTLEICASELKKGGAETVYGLCLFYD
jgi:ComF family protein